MTRIAAVGDLHVAADEADRWRAAFAPVSSDADVLLLAGDLTRVGSLDEAEAVAYALADVEIPICAVLGNHDHHEGREKEISELLRRSRVQVLDGSTATFELGGARLGVAGSKGFGGGFANACGADFGESEMKAFIGHTRLLAGHLAQSLCQLETELRVVLLHYAPIPETLAGERLEIYPFLGSHLLAEAIDENGADLVLHGHAHSGTERGLTPGGVHVRNVAQPVIRSAYRIYCLGSNEVDCR